MFCDQGTQPEIKYRAIATATSEMRTWPVLLALILAAKPITPFSVRSVRPSYLTMPRQAKRALTTEIASPASPTTPASSVSPAKRSRGTSAAKAKPVNSEPLAGAAEDEKLQKTTSLGSGPHPRDLLEPITLHAEHKYAKILTWNVNGFKALVTSKLPVLMNLIAKHSPDIICLQETKLQDTAVDEYREVLPGYDSYWHCSTVKKGYSGTVSHPLVGLAVGLRPYPFGLRPRPSPPH